MKSRAVLEVIRGGWGTMLLVAPVQVLRTVAADRSPDGWAIRVVRILGARHLVQAVLSGRRPSPEVLAAGVWVDGVHALTAVLLAVLDRRRARLGVTDAVLAATWGGAGWYDLVHGRLTTSEHQRLRDRLARMVLPRLPGGAALLHQAG